MQETTKNETKKTQDNVITDTHASSVTYLSYIRYRQNLYSILVAETRIHPFSVINPNSRVKYAFR